MQKLFKKDSKGKIRTWEIQTFGSTVIETYGLKDGKKAKNEKVCSGKNIGKSNETTPEQQAILEAESKIREKLQEDYFKTEKEALENLVLLPMLAKDFHKEKKKVEYPCFAQPKLDGMRCLAYYKNGSVKLISRKGVEIENCDHIKYAILEMMKEAIPKLRVGEEHIFDGELYAHGLSFQENMKLIKKYRLGETEKIVYHIYDYISEDAFPIRYSIGVLDFLSYGSKVNLEIVKTIKVTTDKQLKILHSENIENGYEGTIVRWGYAGYKLNGRSSNLLKYKDFIDMNATIIDVVPMEARPDQGLVVCRYAGKTFKATPKMSHEERKDLLVNKDNFIGHEAEIRYFEHTDDGLPRFPVFVGIRLDK